MRHLFFLIIILLSFNGKAQFADQAIKAYQAANYSEAITQWQRELKSSTCNKEQAYSLLGNAHFKNKNYPQAIVCYERSLRENYNQEDVKFNIKVVRAKLGLDVENKILFTHDILRKICFLFSITTLKITIILLSLLLLFCNIYRFFKGDIRYGFIRNYLFILTLILLGLFFFQQYFKNETGKAVISVESTGFENVNLKGESKTLREGEIVTVLDEVGETTQVETEANKIYWIQKSNIIHI